MKALAMMLCAFLPCDLAIACMTPAVAEEPLFGQERVGFELNLGAGPLFSPAYPGSGTTRVRPFPYVNGGYGEWLDFDVLDGVRLSALQTNGMSMGLMLRLREGREAGDARRNLTGLRSFSDTVEGGAFLAYTAGPLYAEVSLTQDLARSHGGAAVDARVLLSIPVGRVAFTAGPELRMVTRRYAQSYYGISGAEAVRARYGAYRASSGLERIGGIVAMQWRISGEWGLQGYVEYGRLQNAAADSPLVKNSGGSPDQIQAGLFLSYRLF
ncbi:MAG TPA: MipA/OmpV family protein [Roseomonas sp.]|jgi:outer membrane scaffolding protein for murein synthesis (MipA/OmpV family)